MKTFIITGFGRSGTKFLAHIFNRSIEWNVSHEEIVRTLISKHCSDSTIDDIHEAFNVGFRGEVNSYYREILPRLNARRKALILRKPRDIITSSFNWNNGSLDDNRISQIKRGLNDVDRLIDCGFKYFLFEQTASSSEYLINIARYVGITDLTVSDIDLNPINNSNVQHVQHYSELPIDIQTKCSDFVQAFEDKYLTIWNSVGV